MEGSSNGLNQIPAWVKFEGDVRLAPFYDMEDLKTKMMSYVEDINKDLKKLESRGPHSHYVLPDATGSVELTFGTHYVSNLLDYHQ